MNSIKVCEYSRSRSFHDDLILQDQASGERSQDQWSSGSFVRIVNFRFMRTMYTVKISCTHEVPTLIPTMYDLRKNILKIKIFAVNFSIFSSEKNLFIAWASFLMFLWACNFA